MTLNYEVRKRGSLPHPLSKNMDTTLNRVVLRQALYRFFGSLFLYPDEELIANLQDGSGELLASEELWKDQFYAAKLNELIENILAFDVDNRKTIVDEYNRLFLVKPKAPPYETSFISILGQSEGTIAADISGYYSTVGLIVSPSINELPDHIAIELEFMSFLCERELLALKDGNDADAVVAQNEQRRFMSEHLARWYPQFAKKVLSETDEKLFKSLIQSVFVFLRSELRFLELEHLLEDSRTH
jgi:DMSO reductase family type II enzyme chaperone